MGMCGHIDEYRAGPGVPVSDFSNLLSTNNTFFDTSQPTFDNLSANDSLFWKHFVNFFFLEFFVKYVSKLVFPFVFASFT